MKPSRLSIVDSVISPSSEGILVVVSRPALDDVCSSAVSVTRPSSSLRASVSIVDAK